MQNLATKIAAALSVAAIAGSITVAGIAGAKAVDDQPGRPYPVHIEGHFVTGWKITWNDGHGTGIGPWEDIKRECSRDAHPMVCLTLWRQYEWDLGVMRAIIRSS